MASLPGAVAVPAQVDGEGAKAMLRHSSRETFVASGVLAQAVGDCEIRPRAGHRPRAVGKLRAVGRVDETPGRGGDVSRQGARSRAGF